jgi:uncharacterized membrane protein YukC
METISMLSLKEILQWVKDHDGMLIRFHLRTKKGQDDQMNNEIDYFIPAEEQAEKPDEDEEEKETEKDEDEGDEDEEDSDEDEDEDEKPKKSSKSVSKSGKKPKR